MKRIIFLLFLAGSLSTEAQTLKDALFSGRLKKDSSKVIRSTDDLSNKIDTSARKPVDSLKLKMAISGDSTLADSLNLAADDQLAGTEPPAVKAPPKDNDVVLKEFIDSVITTINTEVLPDKKVKDGSYFILVNYEIGTDGQFAVLNVTATPENSFLRDQIKERLNLFAPKLQPIIFNGNPRRVVRKYNFTLSKK